jgi:hypothetical protein
MTLRHVLGGIVLLTLAVTGLARPGLAQLMGDRIEANCGVAAGDDITDSTVTVVCGMPHEQVVEMVRLAVSAAPGDRSALLARLDALIPPKSRFRVEAIARFFEILGEARVDPSRLPDRFAQIAEEHRRLVEEVRRLRVKDPEVQALREAAAEALELVQRLIRSVHV